ncbi:MAG: response regulator transcription factor [Desulfuromonadales bacterium]|jgi:two-component system response regulator NreC
MAKLQLLIVDDEPVVRQGMESFLADYPDLCIIALAESVLDALAKLRQFSVDVILTETCLPDMDGPEAIRLFREEAPEAVVLIYSHNREEAAIFRGLKAGAKGYLLKSAPLEDVANAIRRIHMDEYILSPDLNPAIIEFYLQNREIGDDALAEYQGLTDREKQVFRLLAQGQQTREIGEVLCISPKTVAKHRSSIKRKLALKNPAEMAQFAMRIGILHAADNCDKRARSTH